MSRIEWEYDLVERPFCEQLKTMGWAWIEGSLDDPQATERSSFREVILHNRLTRALQQINLRRENPGWMNPGSSDRAGV